MTLKLTESLITLPHWASLDNPKSLIGLKGVSNMAVLPLRKDPSDAAEMVAQLCYGERFTILDADKGCVKIQRWADHEPAHEWASMQGWIDNHLAPAMIVDAFDDTPQTVTTKHTTLINDLRLPAGCAVPGDLLTLTRENLLNVFDSYMGTPYLWSGQTSWGVDCSGLTQSVLGAFGIKIPRDTYQQIEAGKHVAIDNAPELSIAFFGRIGGHRTSHVGFLIRDDDQFTFIHAKQMVKAQILIKQGGGLDSLVYPEGAGKVELNAVIPLENLKHSI